MRYIKEKGLVYALTNREYEQWLKAMLQCGRRAPLAGNILNIKGKWPKGVDFIYADSINPTNERQIKSMLSSECGIMHFRRIGLKL